MEKNRGISQNMPVGIPKVPFLLPEEEDASWVDLYNRLFRQRLLFLGQEVNSEISNQLVGLMVYLSLEDPTKDLYLFINSPGGGVISGMAIYDIMQAVDAEVNTVCVGVAASMGSLLLLGGQITKRLAFPHAKVMMHQPASAFFDAQTGDSILEMDAIWDMQEIMIQIYTQRTGKPPWQISKDLNRDFYMSPEEAQAYGIIDTVAESL